MERAELEALLERISRGDTEAMDELLAEVENEGPATRQLFLDALSSDDNEELWEAIMLTLADDPYGVPSEETPAPASVEEPAQDDPTVRALQSGKDRQTRVEAARVLASRADPTTVEPLVAALHDDRLVANAAMEALIEIGAPAVPALVSAVQDQNSQVRWHAAKALARLGDPRATEALIRVLDDENSGVRWLAAEGLVAIGAHVVAPLLEELGNRRVGARFRQSVFHVLNKVEGRNEMQTDWLRRLARRVRREPAEELPLLARRALSEWRSM